MDRRLLLIALAAATAGCGGTPEGPPVHPVAGKVLFQGKPAAGVDVYFHPAGADAKAQRPHGKTGPDGAFALTTRRQGDGAPEGEYLVTFFWPAAETVEEPADRLQGRYAKPAESRFRVRVEPGDNAPEPFLLR